MSFLAAASQVYGSKSDSNFTGTGSKKIDALLAKIGKTYDYKEQTALANKGESMAFAEYGTLPVSAPPTYPAYKKGFANGGPAGYDNVFVENIGWQK